MYGARFLTLGEDWVDGSELCQSELLVKLFYLLLARFFVRLQQILQLADLLLLRRLVRLLLNFLIHLFY